MQTEKVLRGVVLCCLLGCLSVSAGVVLHVAVNGDDAKGDGSAKAPFASAERARDEIRLLRRAGKLPADGAEIRFAAGRYQRRQPLALTAEDSGTPAGPIRYVAEDGAQVRISGGQLLDHPEPTVDPELLRRLPEQARPHVVSYDLRKLGISDYGSFIYNDDHAIQQRIATVDNQGEAVLGSVPPSAGSPSAGRLELFYDDRPLPVASGPREGYLHIDSLIGEIKLGRSNLQYVNEGHFHYAEQDIIRRWAGEPDAHVIGCWCRDWAEQIHKIEKLDITTQAMKLSAPNHRWGYRAGQWFRGLNLLCELDEPGEWFIDHQHGQLVAWLPAQKAEFARVEVSMAPRLLTMHDVKHVEISGFIFETCRKSTITMTHCENCRISKCEIRNGGLYGVLIQDGHDSGVAGCDIHDMGAGGVVMVDDNRKTLKSSNLYVDNCHIHHYGRWYRMYRPAIWMSGVGHRATHNLIHHGPHFAIQYGGNNHLMEFNEFHSLCYDANDCSVIYTGRSWLFHGNVIRHNYFHHVLGFSGRFCRTVYLDDSYESAVVYGNIFYQVPWAIFLGGARENTIENNLFIDCPEALFLDNRGVGWQKPHINGRLNEIRTRGTLSGIRFREPPFSTMYPTLPKIMETDVYNPIHNVIARNVFWKGNGEFLRYVSNGREPDDAWWDRIPQALKTMVRMEDNLVNVDPKLADIRHGDFTMAPDSPAWSIGFKRIPWEKIGPYASAERFSWPVTSDIRPFNKPSLPRAKHQPTAKKTLRTGPQPVFTVPRSSNKGEIDGVLTAEEYAGMKPEQAIRMDKTLYHEPASFKSMAWLRHDDTYLYIGVINENAQQIPLEANKPWAQSDAVEIALRRKMPNAPIILLRGYPNGRFESSAEAKAPAALIAKAHTESSFAATIPDPSHWCCEFKIPLELFAPWNDDNDRLLESNLSGRKISDNSWAMWQGTGQLTWTLDKAGILKLAKKQPAR